jgi:hypothetical protein
MKDFSENIQHLYTENYFLFFASQRNPDPHIRKFPCSVVEFCLTLLFYRMGTTRVLRTMHQTSTKKCIVKRPSMTMEAWHQTHRKPNYGQSSSDQIMSK